jgi:hypothetical protein
MIPTQATSLLINKLTGDLKPFETISEEKLVGQWAAISVPLLILVKLFVNSRPDLTEQLKNVEFYSNIILLSIAIIYLLKMAILSTIPGREYEESKALKTALLAAGIVMVAYIILIAKDIHLATFHADNGIRCSLEIMMLGSIPLGVLMSLIKKNTLFRPHVTGMISAAGMILVGTVWLYFSCPVDTAFHLLTWHMGPILVASIVGYFVGKLVLFSKK